MRLLLLALVLLAFSASSPVAAQELFSSLNCPVKTGRDATLVINVPERLTQLDQEGMLVVSTPSAPCVGQAQWHAELRTLTIHGDDPITSAVDGAQPGETLSLHFYGVDGRRRELTLTPTLTSDCTACWSTFMYQHDALYVAKEVTVEIEAETPTEVEAPTLTPSPIVRSVYPNPMRERGTLEIGLSTAEHVRVALFDMLGREVRRLHDDVLASGLSQTPIETLGLAGGAYLLRVEAESFSEARSLVIVR